MIYRDMTNPGSVEELDRKRPPPSPHQAVIDSGRNFLRPDWAGEQIGVWWLFNTYQRAGRMFSMFGQSGTERGERRELLTLNNNIVMMSLHHPVSLPSYLQSGFMFIFKFFCKISIFLFLLWCKIWISLLSTYCEHSSQQPRGAGDGRM